MGTDGEVPLDGQRGYLGSNFAADARYLYFTWSEDEGDIWVKDVAPTGDSRGASAELNREGRAEALPYACHS